MPQLLEKTQVEAGQAKKTEKIKLASVAGEIKDLFSDPVKKKLPIVEEGGKDKLSVLNAILSKACYEYSNECYRAEGWKTPTIRDPDTLKSVKLIQETLKSQIDYIAKNTKNPEERRGLLLLAATRIRRMFDNISALGLELPEYAVRRAVKPETIGLARAKYGQKDRNDREWNNTMTSEPILRAIGIFDANPKEKIERLFDTPAAYKLASGIDPVFFTKSSKILDKKQIEIIGISKVVAPDDLTRNYHFGDGVKFELSGVPDGILNWNEKLEMMRKYFATPEGKRQYAQSLQLAVDNVFLKCGFDGTYKITGKTMEKIMDNVGKVPKIYGDADGGGAFFLDDKTIRADTTETSIGGTMEHEMAHAANSLLFHRGLIPSVRFFKTKSLNMVDLFEEIMTAVVSGNGYDDYQANFFRYFSKTGNKKGLTNMFKAYFGETKILESEAAKELAKRISEGEKEWSRPPREIPR